MSPSSLFSFGDGGIQTSGPGEEDENEIKVEAFSHASPVEDDSILPPKIDSEVEVLHEKVTKQIIKSGYGPKPAKFSRCFCKFVFTSEKLVHSVMMSRLLFHYSASIF